MQFSPEKAGLALVSRWFSLKHDRMEDEHDA